MLLRRSLLKTATAVLFGAALTVNTASADDYIGGWQKDFPVVNYGVISVETATDNLKSQKKFVDYASKELGVQFKLFTAAEYSGIMNGLVAGQVQVGWLGASSYASVWQNCKCVEPIAGAQDVAGGMGYNSVLIVVVICQVYFKYTNYAKICSDVFD